MGPLVKPRGVMTVYSGLPRNLIPVVPRLHRIMMDKTPVDFGATGHLDHLIDDIAYDPS